jgi:hypothetical protein
MFSRVLRQIRTGGRPSDPAGSVRRSTANKAMIVIDLVGVHFFDRFTCNMFSPQRRLFEYIEGSITGTLLEIDLTTFTTPGKTYLEMLNAAPRALETDYSELVQQIRQTPDEFWKRSMLDILFKLRQSMLHWLHEQRPLQRSPTAGWREGMGQGTWAGQIFGIQQL